MDDDELSFKHKNKVDVRKYLPLLLLLVPLLVNMYIRLLPGYLPITDEFAANGLMGNIRNQISQQVNSEFPNLPAQNKEALINQRLADFVASEKANIEATIEQNSRYLRDQFQDENGFTYLGDIDSYLYMRYAQNIIENGHQGDVIKDGKPFDDHMVAPIGRDVDMNLYPEIEAFLYRIFKVFDSRMTFMQTAFLTPLVLSTFAIILAFLIGKKLAGGIGGFFAAMIIATHPHVLSRSLGSDNDIFNVLFPLLILFFFFWALSEKRMPWKIGYSALAGLSVGIYSYAWSGWWYIFYFLLGSLVAYLGYYAIYHHKQIMKKPSSFLTEETKGALVVLGVFFVVSAIGLAIFGNFGDFTDLLNKPFRIIRLKEAAKGESLWPNVYTTVAELNAASLGEAVASTGSKLFFVIALMGIISTLVDFRKQRMRSGWDILIMFGLPALINLLTYAMFRMLPSLSAIMWIEFLLISFLIVQYSKIREVTAGVTYLAISYRFIHTLVYYSGGNLIIFLGLLMIPVLAGIVLSVVHKYKINVMYSILLIMWFVSTIYASSKGIRFLLLLVPPFAIAFSIAIGVVYELMVTLLSKHLHMGERMSKGLVIAGLLLLLISPVQAGYQTGYRYIPHVNDGWYSSLTKIGQESSPDAIINSWWDFGHWFKALADRKVTFDGASQNTPMAHWVGKALMTADEEQAVGILRMLDCGSNNAFDIVNAELKDNLRSIEVIYEALGKEDAEEILAKSVSADTAAEAAANMICAPPENYFITSEDMVGKSGVWAHFGSWDFQKARLWHLYTTETKENFSKNMMDMGYTEQEAKRIYENELMRLRTDQEVNSWIAPWPGYAGETGCAAQGNRTMCNMMGMPLFIDTATGEATIEIGGKTAYPASFAYTKDGEFFFREFSSDNYWTVFREDFSNQDIPQLSVILTPEGTVVFSSPELAASMFTRLFYLGGAGLSHFERFSDVVDVQGQRIIVWKVAW